MGFKIDVVRQFNNLIIEKCLLACSLFITALIIYKVLWLSTFGFDLTDESFYLISIANPELYSASLSQFGFIYHYFYEALDNSIIALRQSNIIITYTLGLILTIIVIKNNYNGENLNFPYLLSISTSLATTSIIFLSIFWIATPSYNTLNLNGIYVSAIGLLLAKRKYSTLSIIGWMALGVGGWITLMAKPSTALVLSFVSIIFLFATKKLRLPLLLLSILCSLILTLATAYLLDGSISEFTQRISSGIVLYNTLAPYNSVFSSLRWDYFNLSSGAHIISAIIILFLFFSTLFIKKKKIRFLITFVSATIILLSFFSEKAGIGSSFLISKFDGMIYLSLPFSALFSLFFFNRKEILNNITIEKTATFILFIILPYIFAYGTGNNYWIQGQMAALLWVLASIVCLSLVPKNKYPTIASLLIPFTLISQFILASLIEREQRTPYRQKTPLQEQSFEFELSNSKLNIDSQYGQYLSKIKSLANREEFQKNTPVIDLTGQSPGTLYAIGAINIAQPWLLGGYPGSKVFVEKSLNLVPCQLLAKSWILTEEGSPRAIDSSVIKVYGADFSSDFTEAFSITAPKERGEFKQNFIQKMMKPLRSNHEAISLCEKIRSDKKDLK
ncbi:hypothetical protein ACWJJH_12200 [Endozoicomonadaceae bacterium StTr2]